MSATDAILLALAEMREELRALRADLRRQQAEPALLIALLDELGHERFTSSSVLTLADEDPHGPIAEALADMLDMNGSRHSRATALGARLARMRGIETVARAGGSAVFRVASRAEAT